MSDDNGFDEFNEDDWDDLLGSGDYASGAEEPTGIAAWKVQTANNIRQPEDLPPMKKILGDVLPDQGVVVFHGKPGSMKSMLLMDAMLSIVSGQPWLPPASGVMPARHSLEAAQSRVFWLDMDQGKQTTEGRFAALRRAHSDFDPNDLLWLSMPNPKFTADTPAGVNEIVQLLKSLAVNIMVIDNLSNIRGRESLNDDGMSRVLENIRYIADAAQCLVIIVHHDAKHTGEFFGSVFIDANLDYRYQVERYENSDTIRVTTTKSRHSKPAGEIIARFDYEHLNKHGQLSKCRMVAAQEPHKEERQNAMVDTLRLMQSTDNLPASKNQIEKYHKEFGDGGRADEIRRMIADLVAKGILAHTENSKNGYPLFDFISSQIGTK